MGAGFSYSVQGLVGSQMGEWAANSATKCPVNTDLCFVEWGVNDADGGVAPDTTASNLRTGTRNCPGWNAGGRLRIVVLGPMNNGEKWGQGANTWDANIAATTFAMKQMCDILSNDFAGANTRITYLDPRAWWFPAIQIANPTNTDGNNTLTVDGLHLNATGASGEANWVYGQHV